MVTESLLGPELARRRVRIQPRDIVFLKGVFEASEGVGLMFAECRGTLILAAPRSRVRELDEVIRDLVDELDGMVVDNGSSSSDG